MKMLRLFIFYFGSFICLFNATLFNAGCQKETESIPIIKELPPFYSFCRLNENENSIIKDLQSFNMLVDTAQFYSVSQIERIDFSKYDLILGASTYTRGISKLEYSFDKVKGNSFILNLTVFYDLTLPAGTFFYGIIVEKLPNNSQVSIKKTLINE